MFDVKFTLKLHTTLSADALLLNEAKADFAKVWKPDGEGIITSSIDISTDEVVPGEYYHKVTVNVRTPHGMETLRGAAETTLAMYEPDGEALLSSGLDMDITLVKEGA